MYSALLPASTRSALKKVDVTHRATDTPHDSTLSAISLNMERLSQAIEPNMRIQGLQRVHGAQLRKHWICTRIRPSV
jgi:hypothetical protein